MVEVDIRALPECEALEFDHSMVAMKSCDFGIFSRDQAGGRNVLYNQRLAPRARVSAAGSMAYLGSASRRS